MDAKIILDSKELNLILTRLCHQLIENHDDFSNSVILSLQPRGVFFGNRIAKTLREILPEAKINYGKLDVTFYRDDFRRRNEVLVPNSTEVDFIIENKKVILIDDVLYTGRTIRAALDAMLAFGRPEKVELMVLIDRRFYRHLPVKPDYVGRTVDSVSSEKVKVFWNETDGKDQIILFTPNDKKQ